MGKQGFLHNLSFRIERASYRQIIREMKAAKQSKSEYLRDLISGALNNNQDKKPVK
jgi:hypothetical protein